MYKYISLIIVSCSVFSSPLYGQNQQEVFELGQQLFSVDTRITWIDSEIARLRALLKTAKKEDKSGDWGGTSGQNSGGWDSMTQAEFNRKNNPNPNAEEAIAAKRAWWANFNAEIAAQRQRAQQASQEMWGLANDMMGSMSDYYARDAQRRAESAQRKALQQQQNQMNKSLTAPYRGYQKRWSDIKKHNAEKERQERARKAAAVAAASSGTQSTSGGWGEMPSSNSGAASKKMPKKPDYKIANPYGKYEKGFGTSSWGEIELKQE